MRYKILLILFIFKFTFGSAPTIIPMTDTRTYDFLDYLHTSKVINIEFTGVKPYRSDMIYEKLKEIKDPDRITSSFINRFEEEYIKTDNRFGKIGSKNSIGWFDPYIEQSYVSQNALISPAVKYKRLFYTTVYEGYKDQSQYITDGGLKACFEYKDFLSLRTNTGVMIKHNFDRFNPLRDEYETLNLVPSGGEADFSSEDHTETSLLLSGEDIYFSIGKYPLFMGSGTLNSLTLSDTKAYYENFMFSMKSDRIKFTTVTGFLLADTQTRYEAPEQEHIITNSVTTVRSDYYKREKYISAHRLEWRALDNLNLGVNEMVVMGDRTIEMGYMIPVLPLFWMGHYYGDHDNSLISFDLKYHPFKDFTFFGELLFDDETFTESWTKNYMNKWAVSAGLTNSNFLTLKGLIFNFEYSRVEPYVYGHKWHINRYMNLDYFLGIPAGPDSETLNFQLQYFYDFDKNITIGYKRENRGEPIWGRWDAPIYTIENKVFLRGTVEKKNYYFANLNFKYNKYISMDIFYSHTDIINYNHNLPFFDENWYDEYVYGFDEDLDGDGNFGEIEEAGQDTDGDGNFGENEHFDYTDVEHYYEREVEPNKVNQVYSNNTFGIKFNFVLKNYFKDIF